MENREEPAAVEPLAESKSLSFFRKRTRFWWVVIFLLAGVLLAGGTGVSAYFYFSRDLPPLYSLRDYRPSLITEVYSDDGTLIAEFYQERRKIVPIEQIPQVVVNAFVAVEDARFFKHQGLDYVRIAGAFWHNLKSGEIKGQGASTITMQVARSFFLSRKKLWSRKLKEAILAWRIERYLNKEEILHLYLNQVYLGDGAYGVQAAAESYFGKEVTELTLAEAALLAGLAQRPSEYSPRRNFSKAKGRQQVVLEAMVAAGWLKAEEAAQALAEPIRIVSRPSLFLTQAPYFTEHVRRYLVKTYGEEAVLSEGFKVFTTVNLELSRAAQEAVRAGLAGPEGLDKRQGYRGPLFHLDPPAMEGRREEQEQELRRRWREAEQERRLAEGMTLERWAEEIQPPDPVPLQPGELYEGLVAALDDRNGRVSVQVGHSQGVIALSDMSWAHKPNPELPGDWQKISRPSQALSKGDVILVRVRSAPADPKQVYAFALEQEPLAQAGLLAFSVRTGEVKALVGGYDFSRNQYIRPVQAARQPGSGFKPIIYGAALEAPGQNFTPATTILDSPVVYDDAFPVEGDEDTSWRPENYGEEFSGPRTLRQALSLSINTISIKILAQVGLPYTLKFARTLGITSPLAQDLSLALGSSPVTLEELCTAYNVYASGGYLVRPRYVNKVYDRDGNLLEWEAEPKSGAGASAFQEEDLMAQSAAAARTRPAKTPVAPAEVHQPTWSEYLETLRAGKTVPPAPVSEPARGEPVISPQTAFLMTNLLKGVVEHGTGFKASRLGKPLAGKTGTTNDFKDAWFIGYSPELICGVWVGLDDFSQSLGQSESGAKAALPIWIDFMQTALRDRPALDFAVPAGIEFAKIDSATGLLAAPCSEKVVFEAFKAGTAPTQVSPCSATDLQHDVLRSLE